MFKGLRQTIMCSECQETTLSFVTYGEMDAVLRDVKSECCNAPYEYIGLQPYHESILKNTFENDDITQPIGIINKKTEEENKMNDKQINGKVQEDEVINETPENIAEENVIEEAAAEETTTEETAEVTQEAAEVVNETAQESEVNPEENQTPITVKVTSASELKIEDVIDTSKKMNKTVMFNALREAMAEDNEEKVKLLKENYPDWFEGTLQYMPKKFMKRFGVEAAK